MIAHLDDAVFPRILISAVRDLVPIDKSLITLEKKQQIPVHVFDSGIAPEEHELHVERYLSGAYLLDPVYQALFRGIKPGFYHLRELKCIARIYTPSLKFQITPTCFLCLFQPFPVPAKAPTKILWLPISVPIDIILSANASIPDEFPLKYLYLPEEGIDIYKIQIL